MANIGKLNKLKVAKEVDFGVYLDGEDLGEILLPRRYVPENCRPGDFVEVFIYLDSEDRLVATTDKPYAMVGDFALLKVDSVHSVGAFLDWGLPKDLFVPFKEQKEKMWEGKIYLVRVYLDERTNRIAASSRLHKFIHKGGAYKEGQEVSLLVCDQTELGYNVAIEGENWGLLYKNEVFQTLECGQKLNGFIKKVRDDGKIDVCLHKPGYEKVEDLSEIILDKIKKEGGFLPLTSKSSPEDIYKLFSTSKKAFKMCIGALYKKRLIAVEDNGIRLVKK